LKYDRIWCGLLLGAAGLCAAADNPISITTACPLSSATAGLPYSVAFSAAPSDLGPYTWTFTFPPNGSPPQGITFSSTGSVSGISSTAGTYPFNVRATSPTGLSAAEPCSLTVLPAAFGFTTTSLPNATASQPYSTAVGVAGGTSPYFYAATGLPDGLEISTTGNISGTASTPGQYLVGIVVTDATETRISQVFQLTVDPPFSIITPTLMNGSVGQPYFQQIAVSPGGVLPYTFIASGLPNGLSMTLKGMLSGTPSQAGTFTITITVFDAVNKSISSDLPITIYSAPAITTSSPLAPATAGQSYQTMLSASGGVGPYVYFILTGGVPGLTLGLDGTLSGIPTTAGTFNLLVQVIDQLRNNTNKSLTLVVNAGSQPLSVAPGSLQFSSNVGAAQGPQNLTVTSGGTASVPFSIAIDDGKGGPAPWLKVNSLKGQTPGIVHVSQVPTTMPQGSYTARLRFSSSSSTSTVDVPAMLTLSDSPPSLTVAPTLLNFTTRSNAPRTFTGSFAIANTGGGPPVAVSVAPVGKSSWVTGVKQSAATVQPGQPVIATITLNSAGLATRLYNDTIRVTASAGLVKGFFDVPLDLAVTDPGPQMMVLTKGVRFDTRQGNTTSRVEQVPVNNFGDNGTVVNWTAQAIRGADLVILTTPSGMSTPSNPSSFGVQLGSTAAATSGGKYALIAVTDSQGFTDYVSVVAAVADAGSAPIPDPDPEGMLFVGTAGGTPPAVQQTTVNTTSSAPVNFVTAASTDDGASWLSASPSSGTTSQSNPAKVTVSVDPSKLAQGVYTGQVDVAVGSIVRTLDINFLVKALGTVADSGGSRAAACTGSSLVLAQTGLIDNFSVPAGWPAMLAAQLTDNCGNPMADATMYASFSNGDPPLTLTADPQSATYTATWQPTGTAAQMTVTINATSASLGSAQVQFSGAVSPNNDVLPSQALAGLLNNFSPQPGVGLAPGTVSSVYGSNLATVTMAANIAPLPTIFNGVQVLVSGRPAPIYYVSGGQVNIQIPSELPVNKPAQIILASDNKYSLPQDVFLNTFAPGVLTYTGTTTLVAAHGANQAQFVDAAHPAQRGEVLVAYLVGMGATSPAVVSGTVSPSSPLAQVPGGAQVTVAGQNANVGFAGLTPTFVGLYQVNFTVPLGVQPGMLDVIITQGGISSNTTQLLVGN
jgi:uncharacterized protein (TIGR03437 family)